MSTFAPNSAIYLCNVLFDNTYKNQIYFSSSSDQAEYFDNRVMCSFINYLYVRGESPAISSVKVSANIDELRTKLCNYMFYQNKHHSNKRFYAFITEMKYINEETTEIFFEQDVYQTWCFDVSILPSFVEREHSQSDGVGENLVPEQFNFDDFTFTNIFEQKDWGTSDNDKNILSTWGYLIGCSEPWGELQTTRGGVRSGIYQGVYFYYFTDDNSINTFLTDIEEKAGESILFITPIPHFLVENLLDENQTGGAINYSYVPATHTIDFLINNEILKDGWITPKNNKLFTFPYVALSVTNHADEERLYSFENFYKNQVFEDNEKTIYFEMVGDISASPAIMLYPLNYDGKEENLEEHMMLAEFPQCSYINDVYKIWLSRNKYAQQINYASAGVGAVAGILTLNGEAIANSALQVANTINEKYMASKDPNKSNLGKTSNNLLTAMGKNRFDFYVRRVRKEFAKTVDEYFTMYGYQTNRVKSPNVDARPYFNYVKTIDINIVGGIPSEHMKKMKEMYNNGVTLWKPDAVFADYSQDNSPQW